MDMIRKFLKALILQLQVSQTLLPTVTLKFL